MVKLEIRLDEPSIDLSTPCADSRLLSVPLAGKLVLTTEKPTQIKVISLKYECINSHVDLEEDVYVYYNLHRSTKNIPPGQTTLPAGVYEYPFVFLVPKNLPPSIKAPLGEVHHRLRANIKRPGHVPSLFYRMAGTTGSTKLSLIVHNSDHTTPHAYTHVNITQDAPPAYCPSMRREWSGQRRNGQIDWLVQGPSSVHISHRADVLAKLTIAKGYGVVKSATVDLLQVEKYQAEPDTSVWTFPMEVSKNEDDIASGSDDGFPETRSTGVSLKNSIALAPLGGLSCHSREKRSHPVKPITKHFPPPPDPSSSTKGYAFHLAMSLPLPRNHAGLFPTHTSPLITITHRLRIRFTFSPADTKELGIILPIVILPAPTPNSINALAVAELSAMESADSAEDFWMVLVEEEGESGTNPQRSRMNSGGNRAGLGMGMPTEFPPQYDETNWPLYGQQRRGSIQMGIAVQ